MLENFKALSQLRQELDEIKTSLRTVNESLVKLNADIGDIRTQTQQAIAGRNAARQESVEFTQSMHLQLKEIEMLRERLMHEIQSFDQVKRELGVTIAKRVETELRSSIADATGELQKKTLDIKAARDSLESLSLIAVKANESLNRLQFVASDIKSKDFDLAKALHVIKAAEQEKIELQQRLDRAESYAAKEVKRMRDQRMMR